jgi:TfoX/Sxy family transcriptional regulator of competence genes
MSKAILATSRALIEDAMPYPPNEVDLQFKFMFGGMGAFARTRIFAVILGEDIGLKLPPDQLDPAHAVGGVNWVYEDKGKEMVMKSYIVFPHAITHDPQAFGEWMRLSIDYVLSLPAKKRPAKSQRQTRTPE